MANNEVTLKAHQLAAVSQAFSCLSGSKPIQLSLTIGKIMTACDEAHELLVEKMGPYVDSEGVITGDPDEAATIMNEEVTLDFPELLISHLVDADLQVTDDSALASLVRLGVISE
jgi:hypothetical protein